MYDANAADPTPVSDLPGPLGFDVAQRLAHVVSDGWTDSLEDAVDPDLPQIGDYLVDRRLGTGGAGAVYHAVLPGWNDEFAIKLFHVPIGEGRAARRAHRELDLVERLDLPDLPRVYEYGVHDGRMFIVSEHVDGLPLDTYCERHRLDRRERVALLARVARAVQTLHDRGVIHRDLKPANVLVRTDGTPMIIDLGVATLMADDPIDTLTRNGNAIGTVTFMAPEQARGEETSIRSDVYSLGATAFKLLTGEDPQPFGEGGVLEAINRVGREPALDPVEVDPRFPVPLRWILKRALAPASSERFPSMIELAEDLEAWLDDRPVRSQSPSWWRNRLLAIKRRPGRWALAALIALITVGSGGIAVGERAQRVEAQAFEAGVNSIVYQNLLKFGERIRDDKYKESLALMRILQDYADDGLFEPGDPRLGTLGRDRNEFTLRVLAALHHEAAAKPSRSALAMASLRALYEQQGTWDEEIGQLVETLLWSLD